MDDERPDFLVLSPSGARALAERIGLLAQWVALRATLRESHILSDDDCDLVASEALWLTQAKKSRATAGLSDMSPGELIEFAAGDPLKFFLRYEGRLKCWPKVKASSIESGHMDGPKRRRSGKPGKPDVRLFRKSDFGGDLSSAPPRAVVSFVFENRLIGDVKPKDAPSAGALGLLKEIQAHPELYWPFVKDVWSKLIPPKSELDRQDRMRDDGRDLEEVEDRIFDAIDRDEWDG